MKRYIIFSVFFVTLFFIIMNDLYSASPPQNSFSVDIYGKSFTGQNNSGYTTSFGGGISYGYSLCDYFMMDISFGYDCFSFKDSPPPNTDWSMYGFRLGVGGRYSLYNQFDNPCSWGMNPYVGFGFGGFRIMDSYSYTYMGQKTSQTNSETHLWINPNIGADYKINDTYSLDINLGFNSILPKGNGKAITYFNFGVGGKIKF